MAQQSGTTKESVFILTQFIMSTLCLSSSPMTSFFSNFLPSVYMYLHSLMTIPPNTHLGPLTPYKKLISCGLTDHLLMISTHLMAVFSNSEIVFCIPFVKMTSLVRSSLKFGPRYFFDTVAWSFAFKIGR